MPLQNDLAGTLQNRGSAKLHGRDFAGAIADCNAAIALMAAIRDALGEAWPIPFRNDLAQGLYARALARQKFGDRKGAKRDVDAALGVQEMLVAVLGAKSPPLYKQVLDGLYRLRRELRG